MQNQSADPTLNYKYSNNEEEYIFCVKGRPFPCLVSPHLPTPTSSLVDYGLVRDVGLKMSDLQCAKFSFGGQKMRILGRVSITVQCIHGGVSSGTFHIKGNVVLDLAKKFDTECIAGTKMKSLLMRGTSSSSKSSPSRPSETTPSTPTRPSGSPSPRSCPPSGRPSPTPPQGRTSPTARTSAKTSSSSSSSSSVLAATMSTTPSRSATMSTTPSRAATMSTTPSRAATMSVTPTRAAAMSNTPPTLLSTMSSPPGFPRTPQYQDRTRSQQCHTSPHLPVSLYDGHRMLSPITANTRMLDSVFHSADVAPDLIKERLTLFECDADGDIEVDTNGNNTYYLTEGYIYESGHGREKCSSAQCLSSMYVPNNCGYHSQFYIPVHFKPCGPRCRGAFCHCLRSYPDY